MTEVERPLTDTEVREIDRLYVGFQPLEHWIDRPADISLWDDYRNALALYRHAAEKDRFDALLQQVLRQAAIDTGAIEQLYSTDRGFTITVAAMATAWEAEIVAQKGEDVARMIVGHKNAYDLALDAATNALPITEALIRRIHQEACAGQDTYDVRTPAGPQKHRLPKGEYKQYPNHVVTAAGTKHAYAPVEAVRDEMHRLVGIIATDGFSTAHPVVQAAWAHHALVAIHPFADGNGRVARVLASIFLLRAASIPLVLFADQRARYLDALADADRGRSDRFVSFVRDTSLDTLMYLSDALRTSSTTETVNRLQRLAERRQETHAAGARLFDLVLEELDRRVAVLNDQVGIQIHTGGGPGFSVPVGYRPVEHAGPSSIALLARLGTVGVEETLGFVVSDKTEGEFPVGVLALNSDDSFWGRVTDLIPEATSALRLRLQVFVHRVVDGLLSRLADALDPSSKP